MISCVSPALSSYEDTHNTLKYASRAMKIKSNVSIIMSSLLKNFYYIHIKKFYLVERKCCVNESSSCTLQKNNIGLGK